VSSEDRLPLAPPVPLADKRKASAEASFQLFLYLRMLDLIALKDLMHRFAELVIGH